MLINKKQIENNTIGYISDYYEIYLKLNKNFKNNEMIEYLPYYAEFVKNNIKFCLFIELLDSIMYHTGEIDHGDIIFEFFKHKR